MKRNPLHNMHYSRNILKSWENNNDHIQLKAKKKKKKLHCIREEVEVTTTPPPLKCTLATIKAKLLEVLTLFYFVSSHLIIMVTTQKSSSYLIFNFSWVYTDQTLIFNENVVGWNPCSHEKEKETLETLIEFSLNLTSLSIVLLLF